MLRINAYLTLSAFFCLILINPLLAQADASAQGQDEKTEVVNQQLDTIEQEFPGTNPQDAEKEFSHQASFSDVKKEFQQEPYRGADRAFSTTDHPDRQSSSGMLKKIVDPDLVGTTNTKVRTRINTRVNNFDVGGEVFYYRYQEPDVGVTNEGPMEGYYGEYAYRPASPNILNNFLTNVYMLQARWSTSHDLEYKGSGTIKSKHDDATELRGLIGKDYFVGTDTLVTPYFGFGYRYLFDRGNGELTSTNLYAYDRKSKYFYLPLGSDARVYISRNWEVDLNAECDIFLQGRQKSYFSDGDQFTGFTNPDIASHQDHGVGVRGSVKFLRKGRVVDFYVEPYIRFWNIEQSKIEMSVIDGTAVLGAEPPNNTLEIGSKFGVQF